MSFQEARLNDADEHEDESRPGVLGRAFSNQSFPWGTRTPKRFSRVSVGSSESFAEEFVVSAVSNGEDTYSEGGLSTAGSSRSSGAWTKVRDVVSARGSFLVTPPRRTRSMLSDSQLSNLGESPHPFFEEALGTDSSHHRPLFVDDSDTGLLGPSPEHDTGRETWLRRQSRSDKSLKEWVAKVIAADGSSIDDIRGFDEKDSSRIPQCCRVRKASRLLLIALAVILGAMVCVAAGIIVYDAKSGTEPVSPEQNLTEEAVADTPSTAPTHQIHEEHGTGILATWSSSSTDWSDGISPRPYHGRDHHFQQSVSMSHDGSMVASVVDSKLTFFVYSDSWKRLDGPPVGEDVVSVSLNHKGTRVAIATMGENRAGHVRVLDFDGTDWEWIGQQVPFSFTPRVSIALSSDGATVVVGSAGDSASRGSAVVLRFNKNSGWWLPEGEVLHGDTEWDLFGMSVAVNYDGNVIAVGIPGKYANGNNGAGAVRIYRYRSEEWIQVGQDINGRHSDEQFGYSISLSLEGTRLVVGVSYIVETCYVYEVSNESWAQLGPAVEHEQIQGSRISVSLSGNGHTLAVGGANRCRVYQFEDAAWALVGEFSGNTDGFGESVSLSSDGSKLAIAGGQIDQDSYVRIVQQST